MTRSPRCLGTEAPLERGLFEAASSRDLYDVLADHGNVRGIMGDAVLGTIARDLVDAIRKSVTIDWTQKESVRAKLRTRVKKMLRKHGYPPDKRKEAIETVIEQAEEVCKDWALAA